MSFKLPLLRVLRKMKTYGINFNKFSTKVYRKQQKLHLFRCLQNYRCISCCVTRLTNDDNTEHDSVITDSNFGDITERLYKQPGAGHNVLMIQPRVKYGPDRENKSVAELKQAEAVALVKTLPDWKVIEMFIIPAQSLTSKFIFGKGNLEKLKQILQQNSKITAVFIGIDIMTALQNSELERYFRIQVFDRYQIILQIFHDHAHTREAKLQLALAEIPYLRVKLSSFSHTRDSSTFSEIRYIGGSGETFMETRRRLLAERELKLKRALEKVKNQRQFLRQSDRRNSLPVIAVVGYTNCGKTTLIKSLTNDSRLVPEDKLFATLDVTLHAGLLPSSQKVLYIDTVGFISNVPTTLIQSFKSTLEEITIADLVLHVRDISHPHTEMQKETVLSTLSELGLPEKLFNSIVEVGNKIDLLEGSKETTDNDICLISATKGTGMGDLLEKIETGVFENTGQSALLVRVPNGGKEYSWLLRQAAIRDSIADGKDPNYLILEIVISSSNLAKFKHQFGDMTITPDEVAL